MLTLRTLRSRILSVILLGALISGALWFTLQSSQAKEPVISLQPATLSGAVGETVEVTVQTTSREASIVSVLTTLSIPEGLEYIETTSTGSAFANESTPPISEGDVLLIHRFRENPGPLNSTEKVTSLRFRITKPLHDSIKVLPEQTELLLSTQLDTDSRTSFQVKNSTVSTRLLPRILTRTADRLNSAQSFLLEYWIIALATLILLTLSLLLFQTTKRNLEHAYARPVNRKRWRLIQTITTLTVLAIAPALTVLENRSRAYELPDLPGLSVEGKELFRLTNSIASTAEVEANLAETAQATLSQYQLVQDAQERQHLQQLLLERNELDPILTAAIPTNLRDYLPKVVQSYIEQWQELEGMVRDDDLVEIEQGETVNKPTLFEYAGGTATLVFPSMEEQLSVMLESEKQTLQGLLLGDHYIVTGTSATSFTTQTSSLDSATRSLAAINANQAPQNYRIAVIPVKSSFDATTPKMTLERMRELVFTGERSIAKELEAASGGYATITGEVFDWVTVNQDFGKITQSELTAGTGQQDLENQVRTLPNLASYNARLYVVNLARFPGAKFSGGTANQNKAYLNMTSYEEQAVSRENVAASNRFVFVGAHELGHGLFGFGHSNALSCQDEKGAKIPFHPQMYEHCQHVEYGDLLDLMGKHIGTPTTRSLQGYWRWYKGWYQAGNTQTITSDTEFELTPWSTESTAGLHSVSLPRTESAGTSVVSRSTTNFYLQFDPTGTREMQSFYRSNISYGLQIRISSKLDQQIAPSPTSLLMLQQASNSAGATISVPELPIGQAFHDPASGLTITPTALLGPADAPTGIRVKVQFGERQCVTSPPAFLAGFEDMPYNNTILGFRFLNGSVSASPKLVNNQDSIGCAPSSFRFSVNGSSMVQVQPSNVSSTVTASPGDSAQLPQVNLNLANNAEAGFHPVSFHLEHLGAPEKSITVTRGFFVGPKDDTTPPQMQPISKQNQRVTSKGIEIAWNPASDNRAVKGYLLQRSDNIFVQNNRATKSWTENEVWMLPPSQTSFTDASALLGIKYQYRIQAFDAAGNLSDVQLTDWNLNLVRTEGTVILPGSSTPTTSTTSVTPATPTITATLQQAGVLLSWSAVDGGVIYRIQRDGATIAHTNRPTTQYLDTAIEPGTTYSYRVIAISESGRTSTPSTAVSVSIPAPPRDSEAPSVRISAPSTGSVLSGSVSLSAEASDASGIAEVSFYAGGKLLSTDREAPYTTTWDTSTETDGSYELRALAKDGAGNSQQSSAVSVRVTNTPGVPSNIRAERTSNGVTVSWSPVSLASSYTIYRNGTLVAHVYHPTTQYLDSNITIGSTYEYTVQTRSSLGKLSGLSDSARVTVTSLEQPNNPGSGTLTGSVCLTANPISTRYTNFPSSTVKVSFYDGSGSEKGTIESLALTRNGKQASFSLPLSQIPASVRSDSKAYIRILTTGFAYGPGIAVSGLLNAPQNGCIQGLWRPVGGDTNGDGRIGMPDLTTAIRFMMSSDEKRRTQIQTIPASANYATLYNLMNDPFNIMPALREILRNQDSLLCPRNNQGKIVCTY